MSASMKWRHLGHFQLLSRAVSAFTAESEVEVRPRGEMANPYGMKVFAVERHRLPEDIMYFYALCGVQSPPLVFAPSRAFGCGQLQGQVPEELQYKIEECKSELLNEIAGGRADCTDEEFAAIKQFVERRYRATAPATTVASMKNAPAPSTSIGTFMPSTIQELRGRDNLGTYLKCFRTLTCVSRCNSALDSEIMVKTSRTPLAELERVHYRSLAENSLKTRSTIGGGAGMKHFCPRFGKKRHENCPDGGHI